MDMIAAQQAVATALAADNTHDGWERIFVDVEIQQQKVGYHINMISLVVVRNPDQSLRGEDISLSAATRDAVIAMYRERLDNAGDKIGSFGLEIDRNGKFRFNISYDPPERINNNWDSAKQQKIRNYLATYQPTP